MINKADKIILLYQLIDLVSVIFSPSIKVLVSIILVLLLKNLVRVIELVSLIFALSIQVLISVIFVLLLKATYKERRRLIKDSKA